MKNVSVSRRSRTVLASVLLFLSSVAAADKAIPDGESATAPVSADREYSVGETIIESNFEDVYADPSKWQELSYDDIFTKGWNKPWASPPAGSGGAPRQGWLNAYEGVFYRLGIAVFGWQRSLAGVSDSNTGPLTLFTPLNHLLEIQTDTPMVGSNRRAAGLDKETNFGDFQITRASCFLKAAT